MKEVQAKMTMKGKTLSLADIGIPDFANHLFKKQSGSMVSEIIGASGECMVQVEPITVQ